MKVDRKKDEWNFIRWKKPPETFHEEVITGKPELKLDKKLIEDLISLLPGLYK